MIRRASILVVATLAVAFVLGCEADDSGTTGTGGGDCPNQSGVWTLTEHCQPDYVGVSMTLTQLGCSLSQIDPWEGWSGTVAADGSMTWSGPAGEQDMTCHATVSGDSMTVSCDPPCDVRATRN